MKIKYWLLMFCVVLSLSADQGYLSPVDADISKDGSLLYIACATGDRIQLFDIKSEKVSAEYKVENVREIALSPDQTRIYALCGEFNGKLHEGVYKIGRAHV